MGIMEFQVCRQGHEACWMPLALWAVHRTFDEGGFKNGAMSFETLYMVMG